MRGVYGRFSVSYSSYFYELEFELSDSELSYSDDSLQVTSVAYLNDNFSIFFNDAFFWHLEISLCPLIYFFEVVVDLMLGYPLISDFFVDCSFEVCYYCY